MPNISKSNQNIKKKKSYVRGMRGTAGNPSGWGFGFQTPDVCDNGVVLRLTGRYQVNDWSSGGRKHGFLTYFAILP
jgi:hypothetical protein